MNELKGYINHSGGAVGSDATWGQEGAKYGVVSRHYYFGDPTPFGNFRLDLSDKGLVAECDKEYEAAAKTLGKSSSKNMHNRNLLRRNWLQVKYSEELFVIGKWESEDPDYAYIAGGAGYAAEMALAHGKPVNFFEQERESDPDFKGQWWRLTVDSEGYVEVEQLASAPILTKAFAGIGTRKINDNGRRAIRECYQATLSKL